MFETSLTQFATSLKQSVATNNTTLPQSVQVVKTRRQRDRYVR